MRLSTWRQLIRGRAALLELSGSNRWQVSVCVCLMSCDRGVDKRAEDGFSVLLLRPSRPAAVFVPSVAHCAFSRSGTLMLAKSDVWVRSKALLLGLCKKNMRDKQGEASVTRPVPGMNSGHSEEPRRLHFHTAPHDLFDPLGRYDWRLSGTPATRVERKNLETHSKPTIVGRRRRDSTCGRQDNPHTKYALNVFFEDSPKCDCSLLSGSTSVRPLLPVTPVFRYLPDMCLPFT